MNNAAFDLAMCWARGNAEVHQCPIEFGAKTVLVGLVFELLDDAQPGEATPAQQAFLSTLPAELQSQLRSVLLSFRPPGDVGVAPKTTQVDA